MKIDSRVVVRQPNVTLLSGGENGEKINADSGNADVDFSRLQITSQGSGLLSLWVQSESGLAPDRFQLQKDNTWITHVSSNAMFVWGLDSCWRTSSALCLNTQSEPITPGSRPKKITIPQRPPIATSFENIGNKTTGRHFQILISLDTYNKRHCRPWSKHNLSNISTAFLIQPATFRCCNFFFFFLKMLYTILSSLVMAGAGIIPVYNYWSPQLCYNYL